MNEQALLTRIEALERDNAKLKRINQALIERVESSNAQGATPYAAFEHSVVLASRYASVPKPLMQRFRS